MYLYRNILTSTFKQHTNEIHRGRPLLFYAPNILKSSCVSVLHINHVFNPSQVEERRRTEEQHLGHVPAFSQGAALVSLVSHWWHGSPVGQFFSLGVLTDGMVYPLIVVASRL